MRGTLLFLAGIGSFLAEAGELLNSNARMELGVPGRGVPGYAYRVQFGDRKYIAAHPDRIFNAITEANGKEGRCMLLPGYQGISRYRVDLPHFYLKRDGEIQISFDAKIVPDETGIFRKPRRFTIDFRCNTDGDRDSYYPMLTGFDFLPEKEWKHFERTFKVRAYTCFYAVAIYSSFLPPGETHNGLCIDNFRVEYRDGKRDTEGEYCAVADRPDQIYFPGDPIHFDVRAELPSVREESVHGVLRLKREYRPSVSTEHPLTLQREYGNVFSGRVSTTAGEYGSFLPELVLPGRRLSGIESPVLVLHPRVTHPFLSPGGGLGVDGSHPGVSNGPGGLDFYALDWNAFHRRYDLFAKAGVGIWRVWGPWRAIEPEKGTFTSEIFDPEISRLKQLAIEPVFVVGGWMAFYNGKAIEEALKNGRANLPAYLIQYGKPMKHSPNISELHPPFEIYDRYLDFVLKHWGSSIRVWEVFNEPFGWTPERYIDYLKHTYTRIKKRCPEAVVLGNGVTGDFGMNVMQWCEKLRNADPHYTRFLDGIAFHPYATGMDYINGIRGRYGECVSGIRSLTDSKPLWNTECYYLETARYRQINNYMLKNRYGSNELLRHFLDGMFHGVTAAPALSPGAFETRAVNVADRVVMNENATALNALSALLEGMHFPCRKVDLGEQVRAGMFQDAAGRRALGFLYDFRITGSTWIPGKTGEVRILDLYGNPVSPGKGIPLSFEPFFLTGTPEAVQRVLQESQFRLRNSVGLCGRRVGGDLYVEGRNLTGVPCVSCESVAGKPVRFSFLRRKDSNVIRLKTTPDAKGIQRISERSAILPATLKLPQGSVAEVSENGNILRLTISVPDRKIQAAPDGALWKGSCVEVFLDPAPFRNLESDRISAHQYVFGVLPAKDGTFRRRIRDAARRPADMPTGATHTVLRTETGYRMEIQIPLRELPFSDIYGLEIEISRIGAHSKESLGGQPGLSFRKRFHYTLVKIPNRQPVRNGDFSDALCGDPAEWNYVLPGGSSIEAKNGTLRLERTTPSPLQLTVRQTVSCPEGRFSSATLNVTMRCENVRGPRPGQGRNGVVIGVSGPGFKGVHYGTDYLKRDLSGTLPEEIYQLEFPVTGKTVTIRLGLPENTSGTVEFRDVFLTFHPETEKDSL